MTINEGLRLLAGLFIILSVVLSHFVHEYWLFFTLFIGANLLQSAFTKWCPAMWILAKMGLKKEAVVE
ncbi:MAG: rhodanese [Gammaproteobacteria bacterium]|nr:MAG: rhodanese [Gammaproteobacteria bacterium]